MPKRQLLPALVWVRRYDRKSLAEDLLAAVIVAIMLIPQSLAYALLAGLPPEMGLYASILPLLGYGTLRPARAGEVPREVPSGVYFARVRIGSLQSVVKLTILQ
jgi:hypothetical protein